MIHDSRTFYLVSSCLHALILVYVVVLHCVFESYDKMLEREAKMWKLSFLHYGNRVPGWGNRFQYIFMTNLRNRGSEEPDHGFRKPVPIQKSFQIEGSGNWVPTLGNCFLSNIFHFWCAEAYGNQIPTLGNWYKSKYFENF